MKSAKTQPLVAGWNCGEGLQGRRSGSELRGEGLLFAFCLLAASGSSGFVGSEHHGAAGILTACTVMLGFGAEHAENQGTGEARTTSMVGVLHESVHSRDAWSPWRFRLIIALTRRLPAPGDLWLEQHGRYGPVVKDHNYFPWTKERASSSVPFESKQGTLR